MSTQAVCRGRKEEEKRSQTICKCFQTLKNDASASEMKGYYYTTFVLFVPVKPKTLFYESNKIYLSRVGSFSGRRKVPHWARRTIDSSFLSFFLPTLFLMKVNVLFFKVYEQLASLPSLHCEAEWPSVADFNFPFSRLRKEYKKRRGGGGP